MKKKHTVLCKHYGFLSALFLLFSLSLLFSSHYVINQHIFHPNQPHIFTRDNPFGRFRILKEKNWLHSCSRLYVCANKRRKRCRFYTQTAEKMLETWDDTSCRQLKEI